MPVVHLLLLFAKKEEENSSFFVSSKDLDMSSSSSPSSSFACSCRLYRSLPKKLSSSLAMRWCKGERYKKKQEDTNIQKPSSRELGAFVQSSLLLFGCTYTSSEGEKKKRQDTHTHQQTCAQSMKREKAAEWKEQKSTDKMPCSSSSLDLSTHTSLHSPYVLLSLSSRRLQSDCLGEFIYLYIHLSMHSVSLESSIFDLFFSVKTKVEKEANSPAVYRRSLEDEEKRFLSRGLSVSVSLGLLDYLSVPNTPPHYSSCYFALYEEMHAEIPSPVYLVLSITHR